MSAKSKARAHWEGDLAAGRGTVTLDSEIGGEMPVDWKTRTRGAGPKTTPEELIAGAHSACFSMALSNILSQGGHTVESLDVDAVVSFDQTEDGFEIGGIELQVHGDVPGIGADGFAEAAGKAKEGCPVSAALSPEIEVTVEAHLRSA